jgi:hypothetical protein
VIAQPLRGVGGIGGLRHTGDYRSGPGAAGIPLEARLYGWRGSGGLE